MGERDEARKNNNLDLEQEKSRAVDRAVNQCKKEWLDSLIATGTWPRVRMMRKNRLPAPCTPVVNGVKVQRHERFLLSPRTFAPVFSQRPPRTQPLPPESH